MSFVLWIFLSSGVTSVMTHQRYDTREQCEQSFKDIIKMPRVQQRIQMTERGHGAFTIDHVCSSGASQHQGGE